MDVEQMASKHFDKALREAKNIPPTHEQLTGETAMTYTRFTLLSAVTFMTGVAAGCVSFIPFGDLYTKLFMIAFLSFIGACMVVVAREDV